MPAGRIDSAEIELNVMIGPVWARWRERPPCPLILDDARLVASAFVGIALGAPPDRLGELGTAKRRAIEPARRLVDLKVQRAVQAQQGVAQMRIQRRQADGLGEISA